LFLPLKKQYMPISERQLPLFDSLLEYLPWPDTAFTQKVYQAHSNPAVGVFLNRPFLCQKRHFKPKKGGFFRHKSLIFKRSPWSDPRFVPFRDPVMPSRDSSCADVEPPAQSDAGFSRQLPAKINRHIAG
jgi:hypothetical protein